MENSPQLQKITDDSTNSSSRNWPETWLKEVWVRALHKRLGTIYQNKFTVFFVESGAINEWCEVWGEQLSGITPDQIKYALGRMQKEMVWPPNAVEFWQLCKAGKGPEPFPQLEPPKALSDVGQAAMEKIRAMLKQKPPSKAWAYRILERQKDGEFLAPIAIQWAQEVVDADLGRKTGFTSSGKDGPTAAETSHA